MRQVSPPRFCRSEFHKSPSALPDDVILRRLEGEEVPGVWDDWSAEVRQLDDDAVDFAAWHEAHPSTPPGALEARL